MYEGYEEDKILWAKYIIAITKKDNPKNFHYIFNESILLLDEENIIDDLKNKFDCSNGTISRWRNGHSKPVTFIRDKIIQYLINKLKEKYSV